MSENKAGEFKPLIKSQWLQFGGIEVEVWGRLMACQKIAKWQPAKSCSPKVNYLHFSWQMYRKLLHVSLSEKKYFTSIEIAEVFPFIYISKIWTKYVGVKFPVFIQTAYEIFCS